MHSENVIHIGKLIFDLANIVPVPVLVVVLDRYWYCICQIENQFANMNQVFSNQIEIGTLTTSEIAPEDHRRPEGKYHRLRQHCQHAAAIVCQHAAAIVIEAIETHLLFFPPTHHTPTLFLLKPSMAKKLA